MPKDSYFKAFLFAVRNNNHNKVKHNLEKDLTLALNQKSNTNRNRP